MASISAVAAVLMLLSVAAVADERAPRAKARAAAGSVVLGDAFSLIVEVEHFSQVSIEMAPGVDLGAGFAERARSVRSRRRGDRVTTELKLEVVALAIGDVEIPAIPISYVDGGRRDIVTTEPVPMRIAGVVGDDTQLRPVARPVEVDYRDWLPLYLAGSVAAALLVLWTTARLTRLFRRRAVKAAAVRAAVRRVRPPPRDEALGRLAELEGSGALDADDRKPAYVRLSEIMRDFVGRHFGFPGLELSTGEIREVLTEIDAVEAADQVGAWLERCDLVKFADFHASPEEARAALYEARRMVQAWPVDTSEAGKGERGG